MRPDWLLDPTVSHAGPLTPRLRLGRRLGTFARYYFMVLGLLGIASMVVRPLLGQGVRIDLTFLIFLLVAHGLRERRNGARVVALVLCGFYPVATLAAVEYALIRGTEGMSIGASSWEYRPLNLRIVVLVASAGFLVFGVPFAVLLHPAVRRLYRAANRFRRMGLRALPWEWCRDVVPW